MVPMPGEPPFWEAQLEKLPSHPLLPSLTLLLICPGVKMKVLQCSANEGKEDHWYSSGMSSCTAVAAYPQHSMVWAAKLGPEKFMFFLTSLVDKYIVRWWLGGKKRSSLLFNSLETISISHRPAISKLETTACLEKLPQWEQIFQFHGGAFLFWCRIPGNCAAARHFHVLLYQHAMCPDFGGDATGCSAISGCIAATLESSSEEWNSPFTWWGKVSGALDPAHWAVVWWSLP